MDATAGEHYEWSEIYAEFAEVAKQEGFKRIAHLFEGVAKIEKEHELRYRALLENVEKGRVFEREQEEVWICLNCGHIHYGKKAPKVCPICEYPQDFFQLRVIDFLKSGSLNPF